MNHYFLDLLQKCVIARLTDADQAQAFMAHPIARFGIIATDQVLTAKALTVSTGSEPAGAMDPVVDCRPLAVLGITYEPFVVADVLADSDIPSAEVHLDTRRYQLVLDAGGFVRDVLRIKSGQEA